MIAPVLRLTRDSAIYALGAVAGKAVAVALVPVLTRSLSPDEFGRFEVLSTLGTALIWALLLGLDRAALRLAFNGDITQRRTLFGSWYAIATALALPPSVLLVAAAGPISAALFGNAAHASAVALVGAIAVFGIYEAIALTVLRVLRRPGLYAAVNGARLVLNAALVVAVIVAFGASVELMVLALALSFAASAIAGAGLVRYTVLGRPSLRASRALFRLGLPLAPAVAANWIAEFAIRAIVLGLAGPTEVAYLGLGVRVASIAGLAIGGLQLAWEPHAYDLGATPTSRRQLAHDARRALVAVAAVTALIALLSRELVLVLGGPAYLPALPAVGFCLIAVLGGMIFIVTSTPSMLDTAARDVGIAILLGIGASMLATVALAARFGGAGAAAGIALGQVTSVLAMAWVGRYRSPVPIAWRPTASVLIAAAAVALASTVVDTSPAARGAVAALFAVVLVAEGTVAAMTGRLIRHVRV